jgi:hypothetical protein
VAGGGGDDCAGGDGWVGGRNQRADGGYLHRGRTHRERRRGGRLTRRRRRQGNPRGVDLL